MPRKLNATQKKLITEAFKADKSLSYFDQLPMSVRVRLVLLNDYETMEQDADRFIWDLYHT